jgi:GNAT superfamily N-acetyltransferase
MPISKGLHQAIWGSRERRKIYLDKGDKTSATRETQLLRRIFLSEMAWFVTEQLDLCPALTMYDEETPKFIIGWIHCVPGTVNFVYVRRRFQRRGYGTDLLHAFDLGKYTCTSMTKAGSRLR